MPVERIAGERGQLFCRYQQAAVLGPWIIVRGDSGLSITGTILQSNFWATQRPITFVTPHGWRWPLLELEITAASFTARLGPMETRDGPASSTA